MTEILAEIPYADARGEIKDIYDRIMRLTGVGSPALIYRHFAVYPDLLQWVWTIAGPELEAGRLVPTAVSATRRIPAVDIPPITVDTFQNGGVDQDSKQVISDMLATYNRMNPVNLCVVSAVRNILAGQECRAPTAQNEEGVSLPPPVNIPLPAPLDLTSIDVDLRRTILTLSAKIPSPGATVIPTLYRHLAIWPDFLRALAPGLLDAIDSGEVERCMSDIRSEINSVANGVHHRAVVEGLGNPPIKDKDALIETLDAFLYTIPQLIVIGRALESAIEEGRG